MGKKCLYALALGATLSVLSGGTARADKGGASACFDRIKSLAGEWTSRDPKTGKQFVAARYRVIAGGTAVEEMEMPGTAQEMVTLFTLDGDVVRLTHYCMIGNQPQMKSTAASTPDHIVFECAGGTGMKSHDDPHMHALTLSVPEKDHLVAEWTFSQAGKPAETAKFDVHRKTAAPKP